MPTKKKSAAKKPTQKKTSPKSAKSRVKRDQLKIPLRITDTTLRDAHQSLWATRMRSDDIMGIIDTIDNAGFYSLEVWGGATFDVCMRFLRENPWERLREMKRICKKTPLQMLLRGQNVLGYKHYPDDLLERFVALACQNGIDIFRIFDALNDVRNLEQAIKYVKKHGGHAQGTISYTISPVHTVEEYVRIAKAQAAMGIDSLCIKDMAGILSPIAAEKLITALVKAVDVPIQVHSHATSGMATATYVEAVRAGAGAIDCAISPMSNFNSQPPVETMLAIFEETPYHANLDVEALRKMCKYFLDLMPKRRPSEYPTNSIDPEILIHHIPGGMISNLRSQLKQQDALDRLDEVLAELPKTRADMGYPPLVTPTSQIVGVQSVLNVLAGSRYKMVTDETKNYVKGLYGKSPAPINPKLKKKILGKGRPIKGRPADLLDPALPNATDDIEPDLIKHEEDIVSYLLFPEVALEFFKWRNMPPEERPEIPADIERREMEMEAAPPPEPEKPFLSHYDYSEIGRLVDKIAELGLSELTVRRDDLSMTMKGSGVATGTESAPEAAPKKTAPAARQEPAEETAPAEAKGTTIDAPLTGTFYRSPGPGKDAFVEEGDTASADEPVCIVEAMKLFNQIKAPKKCSIVRFLAEHGDAVQKGQPLVEVKEL